jgi:hypothetical protein
MGSGIFLSLWGHDSAQQARIQGPDAPWLNLCWADQLPRGRPRSQESGSGKCKPPERAGLWWLTPVILARQEAEIRRIMVWSQPGKIVHKTLSQKKNFHQKGLVDWLEVQALSSNPCTAKQTNNSREKACVHQESGILGTASECCLPHGSRSQ